MAHDLITSPAFMVTQARTLSTVDEDHWGWTSCGNTVYALDLDDHRLGLVLPVGLSVGDYFPLPPRRR